jgi:phenylpyruvate tautomerase PptA (4-oxalocrotonate tautomerase family)
MPLIQVILVEETFTPAQKEQIVRKFTDAIVRIGGESIRPDTLVIIEEARSVMARRDLPSDAALVEQPQAPPALPSFLLTGCY